MAKNGLVFVSIGAMIGGSMLLAACSGAPADSDAAAANEAMIAGKKTLVVEGPDTAVDCGPGEAMTGLSANARWVQGEFPDAPGTAHAILCTQSYGFPFTDRRTATLTLMNVDGLGHQIDNRRAARLKDWDQQYYKLECGSSEYVSGVSESPTGGALISVSCAASLVPLNGSCETHLVSKDWRDIGTGDWDKGYYKGECSRGKVVVGVSAKSGLPHRILCCGK